MTFLRLDPDLVKLNLMQFRFLHNKAGEDMMVIPMGVGGGDHKNTSALTLPK